MAYAYILKSDRSDKYYIGSTIDVEKRLVEHNLGKTRSLKGLRPLRVVFQQQLESLSVARKIENRLKKYKSRIILEKIIKDDQITGH